MILDGADNWNDVNRMKPFLPRCDHGSVLVTTRNLDIAEKLAGRENFHLLPEMTQSEAIELLQLRLSPRYDGENDRRVELINALGNIPLAIVQATTDIEAKFPRLTISKIVENLRQGNKQTYKLLCINNFYISSRPLQRDHSAAKIWQSVFDLIYHENMEAAKFLSIIGRNSSSKISKKSLSSVVDNLDEYIKVLRDYLLVTEEPEEDLITMLPVVQLCVRQWSKKLTFDDDMRG
ncbi:hypothetical protein CI102_12159 [Trichoderma harzianum]|nr:hypothetical protein CI102_12159 [Trichoderma harzianum]